MEEKPCRHGNVGEPRENRNIAINKKFMVVETKTEQNNENEEGS